MRTRMDDIIFHNLQCDIANSVHKLASLCETGGFVGKDIASLVSAIIIKTTNYLGESYIIGSLDSDDERLRTIKKRRDDTIKLIKEAVEKIEALSGSVEE